MNITLTINFLRKIELFKGLVEPELESVAQNVEIKRYANGSLLFAQDSPRENIYLIFEGEVVLYKKTPWGKEERLAFFGQFDFLGEGSLNDDAPHSTTAKTATDATIMLIHRNFFAKNGNIALKVFSNIARVISRRMRHANNRLVNSAAQYVSGRTRTEHDLLGLS